MYVNIQARKEKTVIKALKDLYAQFYHDLPVDIQFLDQSYQALYESEEKASSLFKYFAGIALIISCLGLFSLAETVVRKREKEVGIRKVLGSGLGSILYLLNKDFSQAVLFALCVALPVSYYFSYHWLSAYAVRIEPSIWIWIGVGGGILGFASLVVSLQTIKAALSNPVKVLRDE